MEFGTLNKFWKFSNKIAGNERSEFVSGRVKKVQKT
jgi:hypothetical protein